MLRERPPLRAAPRGLHDRVMLDVAAMQPERPQRKQAGPGWVKVAACLALVSAGVWSLEGLLGENRRTPMVQLTAASEPVRTGAERVPVRMPTARTISTSLERPLMNEAQSVLDDTRRAADFVVSCLPFTRG